MPALGCRARAAVAATAWRDAAACRSLRRRLATALAGLANALIALAWGLNGWVHDGIPSLVGVSSQDSSRRLRALERNGYSGVTLIGAAPNIRLKVREKWAESANPPA